jgi:hypothetical protein
MSSETKVNNLDVHIAIKEQSPKLQIMTNYLVGVYVTAGTNELCYKELHFQLHNNMTMVDLGGACS